MSAQQLPLTAPASAPRSSHHYYVYRVTPKDERTPRNRAHKALGMYTGRFLRTPREIQCHIDNANAIGPDVMGVQVIPLSPCEPDEFWLLHPEV